MKQLLFLAIWLFVYFNLEAQYKGPDFPIDDKWFNEFGKKGLQEGDKMPDIPLGTVINNKTGKKLFSDFRGKLLILDFWNTYCTSCIAGFPKMVQLQKEFGDSIQIILVNTRENESDIAARAKNMKGFKMPDLPCIVSSQPFTTPEYERLHPQPLAKYFPTAGVPHHVWIDEKGIIRLRGGSENTSAIKIEELLAGKPIQFLKNSSTIPELSKDVNARYYQQLGYMKNTPVLYGSFITPYSNEVTGSYGFTRTIVDTIKNTRITDFINQDLLTLYMICLNRYKSKALKTSPSKQFLFSSSDYRLIDFVEFPPGTNILDYTSEPLVFKRQLTTEEMIRSRYCYEQIVPLSLSEEERYQIMLEDLNRYFKVHYGITGSLQNKKVKYYELIRTSVIDKIGKENSSRVNTDAKSVLNFEGTLHELFPAWLKNKNLPFTPGFLYNGEGKPFLLFNGTGWPDKQIALRIPLEELKSIADIRRVLQTYDLDLTERYEDLPLYVFTRGDENK